MSSVAVSKQAVLRLYKDLQRAARQFPQLNYRAFAVRRVRDHFEKNRSLADQAQIAEQFEKGKKDLEAVRRQSAISLLLPHKKTVIEEQIAGRQ
ncbi:hypothetical protein WR25_07787 [Diploscapter pachys]|uniref:Complex 1 LYR protein domain-containing protein n=1 Tax=Diploscapter pachys TaxID=2018661 RepID=A0A2A2JPM7_9BILA|nr:hypothetical protein WR25_07787 [Diploscapter pachys]